MCAVVFLELEETVLHVSEIAANGSNESVTVQVCLELTRAKEEILRPIIIYVFAQNSSATSKSNHK